MKPNYPNYKSEHGFTLLELLTVIAVMGVLASVFMVNFNAQRVPRDLNIARNETITNIRKVQSYTLSSRDTLGMANKFYVITFMDGESSYKIGSIGINPTDKLFTYKIQEVVTLPGKVRQSINGPDCAQVIFAAPFGKMYTDTNLNRCEDSLSDTNNINNSLLKLVSDPVLLSTLASKPVQISLFDDRRIDLYNKFDIFFYSLSGKIDIKADE